MMRLEPYLELIPVLIWAVLSVLFIENADIFQRLGSLGVAMGIVTLGIASLRRGVVDDEIQGFVEEDLILTKKTMVHLGQLTTVVTWLVTATEKDKTEQGNHEGVECSTNFAPLIEEVEKHLTEFDAQLNHRLENNKKLSFSEKLAMALFRLELLTVGIATLQWGFGDLLVNWAFNCGEWTC